MLYFNNPPFIPKYLLRIYWSNYNAVQCVIKRRMPDIDEWLLKYFHDEGGFHTPRQIEDCARYEYKLGRKVFIECGYECELSISTGNEVTLNEDFISPVAPEYEKEFSPLIHFYNDPQRINIYGHHSVLKYSQFRCLFEAEVRGYGTLTVALYDCVFDKIVYDGDTLELHNATTQKMVLGPNVNCLLIDRNSIFPLLQTPITIHHIPIRTTVLEDVNGVVHIKRLYDVLTKHELGNEDAITIADGIKVIEPLEFAGWENITSITIPNSVIEIGMSAFKGCTSLESITVPDSVTEIEKSVFEDCTALTTITIPDSVTKLGFRAFKDCTSLTSITIPDSVTKIRGLAFEGCDNLKELICKSSTPPAMYNLPDDFFPFDDTLGLPKDTTTVLKVPKGSIDAYRTAEGWSNFTHIEEI